MSSLKNTFKKPHGFTLVELIVVITILVILGTIAFTSLGGYSSSARDSSRVSDFDNLKKSLQLTYVKTGSFPTPTNGTGVTFSGGTVWTQGSAGDSVINVLRSAGFSFSKKPTDPKYPNIEYTYSLLNTGKEYQIGMVVEDNTTAYTESNNNTSFIPQTHAATDNLVAYIGGNYNGLVAKVQTGSTTYYLTLPSIILSNLTNGTELTVPATQSGNLVLNKQGTLPSTYPINGITSTAPSIKFGAMSGSNLLTNGSGIIAYTTTGALDIITVLTLMGNVYVIYNASTPKLDVSSTPQASSLITTGSGANILINIYNGSINTNIGESTVKSLPVYTSGNDAYTNRNTNTLAQVGVTAIIWNEAKHWWSRMSDSAVLIPNKNKNGYFNTAIVEGTVHTDAYVTNTGAESTYNKDQTNNLFVSPSASPPKTYCALLDTSYTGACTLADTKSLTIYGGFQGTNPTAPNYHAGYIATGNLSYTGGGIYAGSEQFITESSKTSTGYIQYISRQSYNSNTSYCEQFYGTGWRLPTDYEVGHRNDTTGIVAGNGWNPAYGGSNSSAYFWTSSCYSANGGYRWMFHIGPSNWSYTLVWISSYQVRCVFYSP